MTLNISRSKVYGTTDWFDGEPEVYSITEDGAFCIPAAPPLTRNTLNSFRSGGYVPCDQGPASDFSVRDNVACHRVATNEGASTAVGYKVVSSDEYLYWMKGGSNIITRHHIQLGDNVNADMGRSVLAISLLEENKVCYVSGAGNDYFLYLYDFETTSNELLYTYPIYPDEYTTRAYQYGILTYLYNGVAKTLLSIVGTKYDLDYNQTGWFFMRVYDHGTNTYTDHDVMVPSQAASSEDWSVAGNWYFYCEPALIDGKMIWAGSVHDIVYTQYETPVFVYDFATDSLTRVTIPISETWGSSGTYNLAIDRTNNKVYFNVYFRQDGIDLSIVRWDVATSTFDFVLDDNTNYLWPISGDSEALLHVSPTNYSGDVFYMTDLVNSLFTTGNYVPGGNLDNGSGILWTVNRAGQQLVGYPVAGGSPIIINTNIATDYQDYVLAVQGNKIIVTCNKLFTPRKVSIYKIFNVEAE
jgi:hypothetical protein